MNEGQNPCDLCGKSQPYCYDIGCVFESIYNQVNQCSAHDCFVNYEGSCMLSLYDSCGCRMEFEEK